MLLQELLVLGLHSKEQGFRGSFLWGFHQKVRGRSGVYIFSLRIFNNAWGAHIVVEMKNVATHPTKQRTLSA